MGEKISQDAINAMAWKACDSFRGVLDPTQYKDYILVMLFLKYISDVWKDHYEDYKKQYGGDDERILRKLKRERFLLPKVELSDEKGQVIDRFTADYYSLYERRNQNNIGELINIVLEYVVEANKQKFEREDGSVFRSIDFNNENNLGRTRERNRRLKDLLEDFADAKMDMSPNRVSEDVIGNTYIYLIERFASDGGKKAGEFYTPHRVSELVAKLAQAKQGDRICDPACGSAGLLIEVAKAIGGKDFALFGQEVNGNTWALALMNMFLHGNDAAQIRWGNTLTGPLLVEKDQLMKFNVVVANPPFSLDKWGADDAEEDRYKRFWRGIPPKSKGDYAFISHMIEVALKQEGRVAVVAPHGVLFRGGAEGRIRQQLIQENLLDAVIGLPKNLFPTTDIPVAILIFDRSRERGGANEKRTDVLFIDANKDYEPGKNRNELQDAHISKIVKTYKKRKTVDKYAHLAKRKEIEENDFNLNIPRYVDTFEEAEEVDIAAVQEEIDQLEKQLVDVRVQMESKLKDIKG
ncbi:MAG: type I restriction-modification system subunit M [Proteobacteria bacterium]|nr:type I restriction-modification system subunit M [Pseudomonadota bacterium]